MDAAMHFFSSEIMPFKHAYTDEFVHPNVLYSMEIDAKVRRLVYSAYLNLKPAEIRVF